MEICGSRIIPRLPLILTLKQYIIMKNQDWNKLYKQNLAYSEKTEIQNREASLASSTVQPQK